VPLWPPPFVTGREPAADIAAELQSLSRGHRRAGSVFDALLGSETRSPRLKLPDEQHALVRRVDDLTTAIIRAWLTRDLDRESMSKWSVLADRYLSSGRTIDSLGAHAEAIVLEGILTPEQGREALAILWKLEGLYALLDPQFATRLRLSVSQREELQDLLHMRLTLQGEPGTRDQISELDVTIWGVLNASQARDLERVLGQRTHAQPAAKSKRSSRSG
jgi:hypothetical protein